MHPHENSIKPIRENLHKHTSGKENEKKNRNVEHYCNWCSIHCIRCSPQHTAHHQWNANYSYKYKMNANTNLRLEITTVKQTIAKHHRSDTAAQANVIESLNEALAFIRIYCVSHEWVCVFGDRIQRFNQANDIFLCYPIFSVAYSHRITSYRLLKTNESSTHFIDENWMPLA